MKTIAILSQKGGSGKTTLALHLAVAAWQDGKTAVIADLDEQASATMWHRARKEPLPHVQPTHSAALAPFAAEAARQGVDFLFIDTAPQSDKPALNAAEVADLILITCRPSVMDLRAIQNTLRLTSLVNLKPAAEVFAVMTQIEPFGKLAEEARTTLRQMAVHVLPHGLGRRVAYHHGLIDGQTAREYEPAGKAAREVRALYGQICSLVVMPSSHQNHAERTDENQKNCA